MIAVLQVFTKANKPLFVPSKLPKRSKHFMHAFGKKSTEPKYMNPLGDALHC